MTDVPFSRHKRQLQSNPSITPRLLTALTE